MEAKGGRATRDGEMLALRHVVLVPVPHDEFVAGNPHFDRDLVEVSRALTSMRGRADVDMAAGDPVVEGFQLPALSRPTRRL